MSLTIPASEWRKMVGAKNYGKSDPKIENKEVIEDVIQKKKRKNPEHELQVLAVQWFRLRYPKKTIFAIPNGGGRTKSEGGKLKAEGVLSGVSDLQCINPSKGYSGFFAETKWGENTLSDNQKDFFKKAEACGFFTFTYYTLDEFISYVENYFRI